MKTATAQDLLTRLPTILAWLEAGEEVVVKPKVGKQLPTSAPASPEAEQIYLDRSGKPVSAPSGHINKSVVFQRPLSPQPLLTQADLDELYEDLYGTH